MCYPAPGSVVGEVGAGFIGGGRAEVGIGALGKVPEVEVRVAEGDGSRHKVAFRFRAD